jgi:hypothetical protein
MQLGRLSFALFVVSLALFGCASRQPVATVGGRVINRATYQQTLERYYGRSAVRWLIQRELLLRANEEQKLVSDKDVEREYKNALRQMGFQDERQFLAYLARQGLDKDAFLGRLAVQPHPLSPSGKSPQADGETTAGILRAQQTRLRPTADGASLHLSSP